MKVLICFACFAVDIEDGRNTFVLLKNGDILQGEMLDSSPTYFSMIETMMRDSMNITGRWIESTPKLVGILDNEDVDDRTISVVYGLYIPNKNSINDSYEWVAIKNLENSCQNDISKNVIRYAATCV